MQAPSSHISAAAKRADHRTGNNHRILIVDDNEAIHDDFRKILGAKTSESDFDTEEAAMFGAAVSNIPDKQFEMDFASQGEQALDRVRSAKESGKRYAMAFIDVRMPPGWDGIETTLELWKVDPDIQIVICTAYSDYSWEKMIEVIGHPERLLILKKPFDTIEVLQFAHALTEKWSLLQSARRNTSQLERTVNERTAELQSTVALLESEMAENKRATEHLRDQAEMINRAKDAIFVRNCDDQRIIFWNNGAERLYGWSATEAANRTVADLIFDDADEYEAAVKLLFATGEFHGELKQTTKDGRRITVDARASIVRNPDGSPRSVLNINTDITEQKKLEDHLLRSQRLESIGTLASGVAHDLNNILTPILVCAQSLRASATAEDLETAIPLIEESAKRGASIVKQVLAFARGVEGDRVLVKTSHLIEEIADIARKTFPKSIEINTDYPKDLWSIEADPTQIHQALLNLSVNARDAMSGGGALRFKAENFVVDEHYASMRPDAKPGRYVLIQASDTGAGMPRAVIDKIFDPFFTTKEAGQGTGLGLSTVLGVIKSHQGFISVYSEVGRGTTFKIFLPAQLTEGSAAPLETSLGSLDGNGESILVVDDEPNILRVAKLILEKHNYRVLVANDPPEALAIFVQEIDSITVVLTDIAMPFMDGVALVRALKKIKPEVAFIVSSGHGDQSRLAELHALDVNNFLTKPYKTENLLQAVQQALGERKGDASEKSPAVLLEAAPCASN